MTTTPTEHNSYLSDTLALREHIEGGFIVLAERLRRIRDERMYDPEYDSFGGFLREMRLSESTASKLIGVYEKFVVLGGIAPEDVARAGWTNISLFLPAIRTGEDARDIWERTHLLDRTDAQRTWQEMRSGVDMASCPHGETKTLHVCVRCGIKIQNNDKETNQGLA